MSAPAEGPIRSGLKRLLDEPTLFSRLGSALSVYLAILESLNDRGTALQTRTRLSGRLRCSKEAVGPDLAVLVRAGLIVRLSEPPYLVLRLASWSGGETPTAAQESESRTKPSRSHEVVPVNAAATASAVEKNSGDRGPGEGALVARLEAVVGAFTPDDLRALLRSHSTERILEALGRVQRTPDHRIKKSRLAYFRFLLGRTRS